MSCVKAYMAMRAINDLPMHNDLLPNRGWDIFVAKSRYLGLYSKTVIAQHQSNSLKTLVTIIVSVFITPSYPFNVLTIGCKLLVQRPSRHSNSETRTSCTISQ